MIERLVADAGPLILLAKAGQIDLLHRLARDVVIPGQVVREIRKGLPDDPARLAIEAGFGTQIASVRTPAVVQARGVLGAGEKAVLSVAVRQSGCTALLDDKKGRAAADVLGIPKIGTLGIVLAARLQGHLPALVPVLHALLSAGLYLDHATLSAAAARAGEVWE